MTEVRTSSLKQQQAPTTAAAASGQHVPAVNMAEELLEAVEKLQLRLAENQEPRKVINLFAVTKRTLFFDTFAPRMTVLYALLLAASQRIVHYCYLEIPRITITTAADREMDDRLDRSIRLEIFSSNMPEQIQHRGTFSEACAQLAEMTTTAI